MFGCLILVKIRIISNCFSMHFVEQEPVSFSFFLNVLVGLCLQESFERSDVIVDVRVKWEEGMQIFCQRL